ncbi:MAG: peptide chain release factor N(5)-glutamine methyltransferase [Pseudomonadales bacterium]|nr:peptide chain release factor N(5)-glutamine methyltransferase [Pseudomonadales bacterium]
MTDALFERHLQFITQSFTPMPDKPEETPESILRALWWLATGENRSTVKAMQDSLPLLDDTQILKLEQDINDWKSSKPVAYITERQHFFGLELIVNQQALIPRKETEILAQAVLDKLQGLNTEAVPPIKIIDVCTGCGNLALLVAKEIVAKTLASKAITEATVFGADLSENAVALAQENAHQLGLEQKVSFLAGDLLQPFDNPAFRNNVAILICNPPYISSKKVPEMANQISEHEPAMAFDGGPFGISILQKLIKQAPNYLQKGGWLVFELGLGQGPSVIKRLEKNAYYCNVESRLDQNGEVRVIMAQV